MSIFKSRRMGWVGVVILVLSVLWTLGALWWWAIIGMTSEQGTASILTGCVGVFCGLVLVMAADL